MNLMIFRGVQLFVEVLFSLYGAINFASIVI